MPTAPTDRIFDALDQFRIEVPSWGFADTGTRFGVFRQAAAAATLEEKIADAGLVHALTGTCPTVALHVQWDLPGGTADAETVRSLATAAGIQPGSINPNFFQDQVYKHGSFGNPDATIRARALQHGLDSIAIAHAVGSRDISCWFADGSNYPGTASIRARKQWFEECLLAMHRALAPGQRLLIEYKPFEPAFYHTDIADWGMALLLARTAGPQARVLVDTGHHYPSQNIEQIVAWLLAEERLGGFHFNDRRYADDDLTIGSIDPYQVFRIFHEIRFYDWEHGGAADIAYVIDQSHNLKGKIEAMIQTVTMAQALFAKASLVDYDRMIAAQRQNDLILAEMCLQDAFATDLRPVIREWRASKGLPADPLDAFRESGYLERITRERSARQAPGGASLGASEYRTGGRNIVDLLSATAIAKSFAGVRALKGVSFNLSAGEVHALVGENGAGKSTLIKIITGAETPDAGSLVVSGETIPHMDPAVARSLGIAAIYQHPALFPHLTVAENIAMATEPVCAWRRVDWPARRRQAAALLDRVGMQLHPDRLVSSLSMPEQQIVEIARALGTRARIMVMDEPTASLTTREVEHLFRAIGLLKDHDVGIIYISHRLDEVFALADRITVLRDGETVGTRTRADASRDEITRLMVGRALAPPSEPPLSEPPAFLTAVASAKAVRSAETSTALDLRHLTNRRAGVHDVSLTVARGEIVGMAGLVGSGRTALAETVFGLSPADGGEIAVQGHVVRIDSPAGAMRRGIAYVPEDRQRHAVISELSIAANTSLADLSRVSRRGLIDTSTERVLAERYVDRLRIKATSVAQPVESLSGGNQQKVALARWLATNPSVLILDEPTQGVDVGAKAEIHALMQELAADGLAIMLISSDLTEILAMSDRIAVMSGGRIGGVLSRDEATEERVLALALGGTP